MFHASGDFLRHVFLKSGKNLRRAIIKFSKMEIKMDSENQSQLKRIKKPPLLLSQEESLTEKVKKYPCLFDKSQKTYREGDVVKNAWETVASELPETAVQRCS